MASKWTLKLLAAAICFGVAVAFGVLVAYWYYLGPISREASNWGVFGSVMSGAFTLLSSVATIGTLLFLYHQQSKNEAKQADQETQNRLREQKHDLVVEKQLSALTFEQYLKHRKLFIDRLNEQSDLFNRAIRFPYPEKVYQRIFKANSPSHCDYAVEIRSPEEAEAYDLSDCVARFTTISTLLTFPLNEEKQLELLVSMCQLQGILGMKYCADTTDGDIFFLNNATGFNIYDLAAALKRIEHVLNSILFYSGNEMLATVSYKAEGGLLRDAIYKTLTLSKRAKAAFEIKYTTASFIELHAIYDISQMRFGTSARLLDNTFSALSVLFSERKNLEKLMKNDFAQSLCDTIYLEINESIGTHRFDEKAMDALNKASHHHMKVVSILGVG